MVADLCGRIGIELTTLPPKEDDNDEEGEGEEGAKQDNSFLAFRRRIRLLDVLQRSC